jgi:hypothetical protein
MPRMRSLQAAVLALVGLTVLGRVSLSSTYHDQPRMRTLSASEMNLAVKGPPPTPCGGKFNTVTLCFSKSSTGKCVQAVSICGLFNTCCTPTSLPGNGLCGGQSVPFVVCGTVCYCKFIPPKTTCTETQCVWPCLCSLLGSCSESLCCSLPRPACGTWCAVGNCGNSPPPCCN